MLGLLEITAAVPAVMGNETMEGEGERGEDTVDAFVRVPEDEKEAEANEGAAEFIVG
jgi:hypothetical protein